jgi:hypothetical protein
VKIEWLETRLGKGISENGIGNMKRGIPLPRFLCQQVRAFEDD